MTPMFAKNTLSALRQKLMNRELSPVELTQEYARRMQELNPALNALISWDTERALQAAAQADVSLPLGGLPIAIKDNICCLGEPARCASRMLENFVAPYDATVISKLRAAGALPFGRTNMDEFAMGSAGENSAFGVTRNLADENRVPGGSSSGSAAAVAAGMIPAALGSDTGGSVRQPASHCGVVGLKPTYGRISRYGLVAFASSLDQIGTLTTCVEDAALLLQFLCGHDAMDSTSSLQPVPNFASDLHSGVRGMRIGLPKEYVSSGNAPEVQEALKAAVTELEAQGAEICEISLPHAEAAVASYYIIACAEASSNLARYDGVRYGYRAAEISNAPGDLYARSRTEGFGEEVKRRIILGTYVLSGGYYDAYYTRAQKVRALVARDFSQAFESGVQLILGPVAPTPAPKLQAKDMTPLQIYLADIYTVPANLAGLPATSVPTPQSGLPVGVQLLAPHFEEARLLRGAAALERAWS